jgi:hypothetical protein
LESPLGFEQLQKWMSKWGDQNIGMHHILTFNE